MYNGNLISLKTILWRVYQHPLADGLNYEDAAEYAISGLRLIGAPLSYIDKVSSIQIVNNKGALPNNIITIRGVKLLSADGHDIALRRATDIYHASIPCEDEQDDEPSEYTYIAQNGVIQTSIQDGDIVLSYKALACDEHGYPLIPDNEQVKLCLEYYILFRFLEPLFIIGKVTDKAFNYIDQKKCFYMGASNTSMQLQGGDHLESVMNAVNRLIINDRAFENFYQGSGFKERIKRYN